jgi:peroxiredoxin
MTLLEPGDAFPSLKLPAVGGGAVELPDAVAGHFAVVLVYRGAWCPYCSAQLRAFERASEALAEQDVRVVALSVDDEASSAALAVKLRLTFPVLHSAPAKEIAASIGSFVDPRRGFLQSTGFVLDPAGAVMVSVYSSGAIGRLVPEDVVGLVKYAKAHAG